jgi:NADH:ubiquinone oxidoreductase subunit 4 (subunit M)
MFMSFAVKVPMWPVHTWLPDAHVEAPTGGSVILAAITLKVGGYGFLRFSLPVTPDASQELAGFMIVLSLIAVVYIGLVALVQSDMKKLIAYSSISHMGFVTLGIFIFNADGMRGGMIQMISHGFIPRRCSFASASSTTASIPARSRPTAAWPTACRSSPRSSCSSPWRTRAPGHERLRGEFMVVWARSR